MSKSTEQKLNKIKNYKGNVIARWKWDIPRNEKEAIVMIRKALRLFYRAKDGGFLITDLLNSLKKYLDFTTHKASALLVAYPEIILGVREVKNYNIDDKTYEVIQEKVRKKEIVSCSLCRTKLRWPAYVVERKNEQIVSISNPIGIRCLNGFIGKLRDLVTTFDIQEIQIEQEKKMNSIYRTKLMSSTRQLSLF